MGGAHKPTGKAILWQMTLAGLITGLVAIVVPQVMGNGRAASALGISAHSFLNRRHCWCHAVGIFSGRLSMELADGRR